MGRWCSTHRELSSYSFIAILNCLLPLNVISFHTLRPQIRMTYCRCRSLVHSINDAVMSESHNIVMIRRQRKFSGSNWGNITNIFSHCCQHDFPVKLKLFALWLCFVISVYRIWNTRWFKYDRDWLRLVYTQMSPGHIWITLYICTLASVFFFYIKKYYSIFKTIILWHKFSKSSIYWHSSTVQWRLPAATWLQKQQTQRTTSAALTVRWPHSHGWNIKRCQAKKWQRTAYITV
jgi:hypothetical protein